MGQSKIWTKNFICIMLANFFVALIFYLLMTTMALYATNTFNVSASLAGLATSIFFIGGLITRLITGRYLEVIGRKKMLYFGLLLFLVMGIAYLPVKSFALLLVVRFIHGMAFGISNTGLSAVVVSYIPSERKGEGIGYFTLSATLATAIGPFVGLYILQNYSYSVLFVACALCALFSLLLILCVKLISPELTDEQIAQAKSGFKMSDFFEKTAVPIAVFMIIIGICYSGIVSFVGTYAVEKSLTKVASYFFIVYSVGICLSRPFTGKLLDRKGNNSVMYPALILFVLGFLVLALTSDPVCFLGSGILFALGFGNIMSAGQAIAVKCAPAEKVGLATSTFFFCCDVGMGIGPVLLGMLVPFTGYSGVYLALAGVVLVSVVIYYLILGRKNKICDDDRAAI